MLVKSYSIIIYYIVFLIRFKPCAIIKEGELVDLELEGKKSKICTYIFNIIKKILRHKINP